MGGTALPGNGKHWCQWICCSSARIGQTYVGGIHGRDGNLDLVSGVLHHAALSSVVDLRPHVLPVYLRVGPVA